MDIQSQLNELAEKFEQLTRSVSIPRNVETAFRERLGLGNIKSTTGSATTTTTPTPVIGASVAVVTPTVSGTLPIVVGGITYNILFQ